MKKIWICLLISAMLVCALPVTAADFDAGVGKNEIPYGPPVPGVQAEGYDAKVFNMMTAAEAAEAGVPAGYTGDWVLALTGPAGTHVGFMLDRRVKHSTVRSFTIRMWCPTDIREFRITANAGMGWIARITPAEKNAWIELTFSPTSGNYFESSSFDSFAGTDGYFKPVNVGFRFENTAPETTVYIDSITFDLTEQDTVAPVFRYDGKTELTTSAGKPFVFGGTAYDDYDGQNAALTYKWSEGALDANGHLTEGDHACTVTATDLSGNRSEIKLTVHVLAPDTEAPVISFASDTVRVTVNTVNRLTVPVTDNYDRVEPVLVWSDGALDSRGRFLAGTHTLTVTATDLSGNTTQKTISVVVTDTLAVAGELVCDTQ